MVSFFSITVGSKEASLDTHSLEDCIQQQLGVWKEAKQSSLLATEHDMFGNNAEVGADLRSTCEMSTRQIQTWLTSMYAFKTNEKHPKHRRLKFGMGIFYIWF
jgi:hypothetical protein